MYVRVDSSAMTRFISRSTLEIPTGSQLRACVRSSLSWTHEGDRRALPRCQRLRWRRGIVTVPDTWIDVARAPVDIPPGVTDIHVPVHRRPWRSGVFLHIDPRRHALPR